MRIRRNAGRLLGSAYSAAPAPPNADAAGPSELLTPQQPPPPHPEPGWAPESCAVGGFMSPDTALAEPCELSRSPWDLIAELSISDPQVEDDLVDKYFVSVTCRASWLFPASKPVSSVKKEKQAVDAGTTSHPPQEVLKKVPKKLAGSKETEPKKKSTVKKEDDREVKQPTYRCKKNDGRRWQCLRPVRRPDSLCDYHLYQKRAYLNPEFAAPVEAVKEAEAEEMEVPQPAPPVSKPATSSKSRKKKPGHDFGATEGFYYYAGFGPCRSKRICRSSGMNEFLPPKKEEEEAAEDAPPTSELTQAAAADSNQPAAARDGESGCIDVDRIAGVDEDSSDDNYSLVSSGRHRAGNSDGKRKDGCKRWRKPVKARSLKSLM